jgi:predicted nucleic acid-binding OB-fold protein
MEITTEGQPVQEAGVLTELRHLLLRVVEDMENNFLPFLNLAIQMTWGISPVEALVDTAMKVRQVLQQVFVVAEAVALPAQ